MNKTLLFTASVFYPVGIYDIIRNAVGRSHHDDKLVLILFFLIIFFLINFLIISIISLILLIIKTIREKKIKQLSEIYQGKLAEYIFYEGEGNEMLKEFSEMCDNRFKREVLTNEILNFSKNLYGEAKTRPRELYMSLKLYEDSIKYAKSNRWYIQAKGFRQLSQMNVTDAKDLIEEKLNSKNDILSFEAQLAMVQLNPDTPFSFLDKLTKYFPLWNQLNIHMLIHMNNFKVPEFSRWLNSQNYFVTVFSLRMIGVFRQQKAFGEVALLLKSTNIHIKQNAIIALGKLGLNEGAIYLRNIYLEESDDNKILILKALQNLPDESNMQFLGDILLQVDNNIKLEAAKGLAYIGEIGRNKLQMLKITADVDSADTVSVINHTLDRRIV